MRNISGCVLCGERRIVTKIAKVRGDKGRSDHKGGTLRRLAVIARSGANGTGGHASEGKTTIEACEARRCVRNVSHCLATPHALGERCTARPCLVDQVVLINLFSPQRNFAFKETRSSKRNKKKSKACA